MLNKSKNVTLKFLSFFVFVGSVSWCCGDTLMGPGVDAVRVHGARVDGAGVNRTRVDAGDDGSSGELSTANKSSPPSRNQRGLSGDSKLFLF